MNLYNMPKNIEKYPGFIDKNQEALQIWSKIATFATLLTTIVHLHYEVRTTKSGALRRRLLSASVRWQP